MTLLKYQFKNICLGIFFICFSLSSVCYSEVLFTKEQITSFGKEHGTMAQRRLKAWLKIIQKNKFKTQQQKLTIVNNFFNQFRYRSDISFVGKADYWMTPLEFIIKFGGDCEDFSIAKYFTLVALGVPTESLRITYVKALNLNQAHMVLAYYPNSDAIPLILDNLTPQIKKASERKDLKPVYSFNANGLWLTKLRNQSSKIGTPKKLSKWQSMLKRMQKYRKRNP